MQPQIAAQLRAAKNMAIERSLSRRFRIQALDVLLTTATSHDITEGDCYSYLLCVKTIAYLLDGRALNQRSPCTDIGVVQLVRGPPELRICFGFWTLDSFTVLHFESY